MKPEASDRLPRGFGLLSFALIIAAGGLLATAKLSLAAAQASRPDNQRRPSSLQEQINQLQAQLPNQSTVMTHVAYHFTNLWFAANEQNWPLADYYLGEVRSNLKWAVRVRPVRDGPSGEVQLAGITEALDNTELTQLQKAIQSGREEDFVRAYDDTILVCDSCHQAIGKPYLQVQRPRVPEVQVINFGRGATSTEQSSR